MIKKLLEHAKKEHPNECCGLISGGIYYPCKNVSDDPQERFAITPNEWRPCDVVVHSHPAGQRYLSGADRIAQVRSGLPWWVVVGGEILKFPCVAKLKGREFEYGVHDCVSLLTDAYLLAGIILEKIERAANIKDNDILAGGMERGFYRVDIKNIQAGDVIATSIRGVANHVSIYMGNEQVLHHPLGGLSRVEKMGGIWHKAIHSVWRHGQWTADMLTGITNDLEAQWPQ